MVRRITTSFLVYIVVTVLVCLVRGDAVCEGRLADAEARINLYLKSSSVDAGKFHVQGWRWHTMSLVRESRRLHELALKLQNDYPEDDTSTSLSALKTAADYTVGFNMKGLHRIEKDLFFPWVRSKTKDVEEKEVVKAFDTVLDQLESDRQTIENLGASLIKKAALAADLSASRDARSRAISEVASDAAAIAEFANSMLLREEAILVPAVARIVSGTEQKSFNNKVIRKLGVLDSRLHLVGMYEAVWDLDDKSERQLFQETIPSIPQMMIPRWKRLFYEPRTGALDKIDL